MKENQHRYLKNTVSEHINTSNSKMIATALLQKNLQSFKIYCPSLYQRFLKYQPKEAQFHIDKSLNHNILMQGELIIKDTQSSQKQIQDFIAQPTYSRFSIGNSQWATTTYVHDFHLERLRQIFHRIPIENHTSYPDLIPCILFLGVGLGEQITALDKHFILHNIFIYEPSNDIFYASLHHTDYTPLLEKYSQNERKINFHIGTTPEVACTQIISIIREDISYAGTEFFFFERHSNTHAIEFARLLNETFHHGYNFLGFLEDELIGLKHVTEKLNKGSPYLNKSTYPLDIPAFIIGSGPSLDHDLDFIREQQNSAIIFSTSSSVEVCYKHGIQPDFHVEVERNKIVVERALRYKDPEFRKKIHLLGVSTLHPDIIGLFATEHFALKSTDLSTNILNNITNFSLDTLHNTHPTSGNGAISFAIYLGFKTLVLFGLDMGMPSESNHHSQHSLYYDVNKKWELPSIKSDLTLQGNFGGTIYSTYLLETSRNIVETELSSHPCVRCFNSSDGALIKGAQPRKSNQLVDEIHFKTLNKTKIIEDIFHNQQQQHDYPEYGYMMKNYWTRLYLAIERTITDFASELQYDITTKEELFSIFYAQKRRAKVNFKQTASLFPLLNGTFIQLQNTTSALLLRLNEGAEFNQAAQKMFAVWDDLLSDSLLLCREFLNSENTEFDFDSIIKKYPEFERQSKK